MRHYTDRLFFDDSNKSEGRFGRWSGLKGSHYKFWKTIDEFNVSIKQNGSKQHLADVTADLFSRLKIG
jgi:hypothetical protein